jgi:hypothetical protein
MWTLFPADTQSWIDDDIGWYLRGMLMRINSVDTHVWKYETLLSLVLNINEWMNEWMNESINQSINQNESVFVCVWFLLN